jgi:hypothetical protein
MSDMKKIIECSNERPKYESPKLNVEGSYSNIFSNFRVGPSCSAGCSRHVPEM